MKRRLHDHMRKFSRALKVAGDDREPALTASLRDVQRHYRRKDAAYRAMLAHRKALNEGIAITEALAEKPPGVTQLLCRRMYDTPWCRALIDPWLVGERVLTGAEIERMASFVVNKWGEPKSLPPTNTIRRQLARQFKKHVKS
jgi:hypothetical protein